MRKLKNVMAVLLMFLVISLFFALLPDGTSAQDLNFEIRETIEIPSGAVVNHIGDMDDDGILDIVYYQGGSTYVIERDNGSFIERFSTPYGSCHVVAEVDGDNYPDFLVNTSYDARIFEATGNNAYTQRKYIDFSGKFEWPPRTGDSDGDGKREFLISSEWTGISIYEADSDNTYVFEETLVGTPGGNGNIYSAGVYDFDDDGNPETVFVADPFNQTSHTLYVFSVLNGNRQQIFYDTSYNTWISSSLGDLDGDGLGEIIGVTLTGNDLLILESDGTNNNFIKVFQAPRDPDHPYNQAYVMDFDEDGQSELWRAIDDSNPGQLDVFTLAHLSGGTIIDFYNSGDLLQGSGDIRGLLAIGDTNSDGGLELAVVQGDQIHILEQTTVSNQPPVANAGVDQAIHTGNVVTLDGSGSTDPDGNYPLTYAWTMTSKPIGSSALLTNADTPSPSFEADVPGDYTIKLVVTDSKGLSSTADQVLVSTFNTPPVADAGSDQAILEIGTTVSLGTELGRGSYDSDGDTITYLWTMLSKPSGSAAILSDPKSETPTFLADVYGDYEIELVVSDPWISSTPDTVVVSFENVAPVADAKVDQPSVVQGETVNLDGTGSSDANGDFLYYNWSVVLKPVDSTTDINNPTEAETSFLADVPGEYIVSLVVNDNIVGSDPSNVTIVAISFQDATTETLQDTTAAVNSIDIDVLKNKNMLNALTNKINAALKLVDQGQYEEALNKLQNDILSKTNGCADTGSPDKNDWIKDCDSQDVVYPLIIEAIEHLMNLQ